MNESKSRNISIIIVALILAIGAIICCYVGVYGLAEYKRQKNSISINGIAEQQIKSDFIVWTCGYNIRAKDIQEGYRNLEAAKEMVKKYLMDNGISESKIVFESISIYENYAKGAAGDTTNTIESYDLYQSATIQSEEVDKITEISRNITELIGEGIDLESYSPEYHYTQLSDLKISLIADATADATKRATMIAENAGSKLGKLKYAKIASMKIKPLYSDGSDYYDYYDYYYDTDNDTASLEKEVTVTVYCSFEID